MTTRLSLGLCINSLMFLVFKKKHICHRILVNILQLNLYICLDKLVTINIYMIWNLFLFGNYWRWLYHLKRQLGHSMHQDKNAKIVVQ